MVSENAYITDGFIDYSDRSFWRSDHSSEGSENDVADVTPAVLALLNHYEGLLESAAFVCQERQESHHTSPIHRNLRDLEKIWRFLLIIARLDMLAESMKSNCAQCFGVAIIEPPANELYTCSRSCVGKEKRFSPPARERDASASPVLCHDSRDVALQSWMISKDIYATTEAERLRFLFLVCRSFRLLLALIEWCQWVAFSRMNHTRSKSTSVNPYFDPLSYECTEMNTGVANLCYSDTLFQLTEQRGHSVTSNHPLRPFHLDLPFTLGKCDGENVLPAKRYEAASRGFVVRTSAYTESATSLSGEDLRSSGRFFKTIWKLLLAGRFGRIVDFANTHGEPWIESILCGQLPAQDANSTFSVLYDAGLNNIPEKINSLLDEERDVFSFKDDTTRSTAYVPPLENVSTPETYLDLNPDDSDFLNASWVHNVLFERSSDIIRTDRDLNIGEEFSVGNQSKELFLSVARAALQGTSHQVLSVHEKAVLGYLVGSSDAMLPASETWEERLWVYAVALRERLVIVCRDAAMSSQTCFVSAPSIDTETTPFFDDVAFKGSAVVLNLRDELEHMFEASNSDFVPEEEREVIIWRRVVYYIVRLFLDPLSGLAEFLRFVDAATGRHAVREHRLIEKPEKETEVCSTLLYAFFTHFFFLYKHSIANALPAGSQKNQWIAFCDDYLGGALVSKVPVPDELKAMAMEPIKLLSALSEHLQPQMAAALLEQSVSSIAQKYWEPSFLHTDDFQDVAKTFLTVFQDTKRLVGAYRAFAFATWASADFVLNTSEDVGVLQYSTPNSVMVTLTPERTQYIHLAIRLLLYCYDHLTEATSEAVAPDNNSSTERDAVEFNATLRAVFLEFLVPLFGLSCCQNMMTFMQRDNRLSGSHKNVTLGSHRLTSSLQSSMVPSYNAEILMGHEQRTIVPKASLLSGGTGLASGDEERFNYSDENGFLKTLVPETVTDRQLSQCIELIDDRLIRPVVASRGVAPLTPKRQAHSSCAQEEPTEQPSFELNKEQRELQCNNEVQLLSVSHYLFIRHLAELFLTLKDARVLILDSAFRVACHQPIKTDELSELTQRLIRALGERQFLRSPHLLNVDCESRSDALFPRDALTRLDRKLCQILLGSFFGVFSSFSHILESIPLLSSRLNSANQDITAVANSVSCLLRAVRSAVEEDRLVAPVKEPVLEELTAMEKTLGAKM